MCVIVAGKKQKPTADELRACAAANPDGNGVAWVEDGLVRFEKGIALAQVEERVRAAPSWWAAHFRIGTAGGKSPELCHPFPVERDVPLALSGSAKSVLFHNGHVGDWEETVLARILSSPDAVEVPPGAWSDSRAYAWLVARHGRNVLSFASGKWLLLTRSGPRIFPGSQAGWSKVGSVWYSNTNWVSRTSSCGTSSFFGSRAEVGECESPYGWPRS